MFYTEYDIDVHGVQVHCVELRPCRSDEHPIALYSTVPMEFSALPDELVIIHSPIDPEGLHGGLSNCRSSLIIQHNLDQGYLIYIANAGPYWVAELLVNRELISQCQECGEYIYRSDEFCGGCMDARHRDSDSETGIMDYSEDVLEVLDGGFKTMPNEPSPLFMGVELEVEARDDRHDAAERVLSVLQDSIIKEDGSLDDDLGMEIVTLPLSYRYHKEVLWKKFFEDAPSEYLKGWHGHNCGMHVHIARESISPLTLGKMLVFVNACDNVEFIQTIAGRSFNTYCERFSKRLTDGTKLSSSHYDALSISSKNQGRTVELRIFRSNIEPNGFYKNLDFCAALVHFCSDTGCTRLSHKDFCKFMSSPANAKLYKHLYRFMVQQDLVIEPRKPKTGGHNAE